MKKLSTVLLALSMLFGSDVDARARGKSRDKKRKKTNKDVQFSSENLVQKVLELSAGKKEDLEALGNVAKTLSEMVEKNPAILTQVQDIVKETETVKETIEGKKGKGKKGKKVSFKKNAAKLVSALGKLISAQNPNDSFAEVAKKAGFQDAKSLEEMQAALKEIFAYSVKTDVKPEEQAKVNEAKVLSKQIQENLSKALGANVKPEEIVSSFEAIVSSFGGKYAGFKVVDTATAESAPAKFDALLKSSKLIAEVNKEIDLSRRFSEGLKFNSEKLVKDLNAALTEKDETKKFEALKALFASLDPQYTNLTAPVLSDADVVSKVQSLYLQDPNFQGTAKLADLNAAVEAFRAAYVAASEAVKGTMCAGLKALEAEKVASDNISARVEYLRDNGTYTASDAQASASVYSVVKKLFDQPTADLYKNSLKASKGTITAAQTTEFNDFVAQLQGCVEDVEDSNFNKIGIRLTSDTANALTSDERAVLDSFIKGSTFADMRQEFVAAMATFAVTNYDTRHAHGNVATFGKLNAANTHFANEIQNLKNVFGYIPTKSKKTKVGDYKLGDMLVGNTTVVDLIKRCSSADGLNVDNLKQDQAVRDHFQNKTNKINQFANSVQTWMRDLEIFPAQNAYANVARADQASRQIGGDLFARANAENDLARQTLASIFDCVINKRPVTDLANSALAAAVADRAGRPAVTAPQYEVAVRRTKQLLDIIRG